ncbi:serine/threonine-protein phosphatase 2B catalytic subunit 2-like [Hermetia illucens]|uniref:serine/threonine-protein phosphatase 2B catalytic subunit 2-like n=1 Tax=Hermetia illucens TaxID=343691 RepID=UPI0018CC237B|nr:serine/threonine-protein phosphatase 2B catalytic subunit 2-like [Hermetia illucens]
MKKSSATNLYRPTKYRGRKQPTTTRKTPHIIQPSKPAYTSRVVDSVPYPETHKLTSEEVYGAGDTPITSRLIEHFRKEGRLEEAVAKDILLKAGKVLTEENTLIEVSAPINICGDIHGQFYDLVRLFTIGGHPPNVRYLFLGDYVDRGPFGIEVILVLFSMKINYPNSIFLLRGNHECRHLTESFTFKRECELKYSTELYDTVMDVFDALPLSAVVNNQFLCMHGGLSPDIYHLNDIRKIARFREPPVFGAMCDLLWSDPATNYDNCTTNEYFTHNFTRGCSYFFSYGACCDFLKRNKLLCIIRAHEVQATGFRMYKKNLASGYPSLITVFSAPNYLDLFRNKGAILKYVDNNINIQQYAHSPHPYWLPNFMDVFTWSLPFIAERVAEIFSAVLNICSDDELLADSNYKDEEVKMRHDIIRKKIRALGKLAIVYGDKRKESETAVKLQGATPTKEILKNVSQQKVKTFKAALADFKSGQSNFSVVQSLDNINEEYPNK